MRPMSLKWRISILSCLALTGVTVTNSMVAYHELGESLTRNLDRSLHQMARAIDAELEEARSPEAMKREIQLVLNGVDGDGGVHYRVWNDGANDDLLASDSPDSPAGRALRQLPANRRGDHRVRDFSTIVGSDEHRVVWLRRTVGGQVRNTTVAYPLAYAEHEKAEFLRMLLVLGGLVVIGSFGVSALLVFWGLRPIGRTADRLRDISDPGIGGRALRDSPVPPELDPFRNAVVQLLDRTDQLLRRQQEFTADASHEMRTPLALAKSTLQAVRMRNRDEAAYCRAIDDALNDLGRMESLIGQLLALARLDGLADSPLQSTIDLRRLLDNVAGEFAQLPVTVADCQDAPAIAVRGDEGQLSQVFRNLVGNAVRHGPPGGTVRISARLCENGMCLVTVHDTGGAIPPEELGKLFDRFYRADASRARATGGAGLGLAIARAIVLRHCGRIEIASSPEAGTTVSVYLPAVPAMK